MSRRESRYQNYSGESEDSVENRKPNNIYSTPDPKRLDDQRRSSSGRKIKPVQKPDFYYQMVAKVEMEREKRAQRSAAKAAIKKMNTSDASGSSNRMSNESSDEIEPNVVVDVVFDDDHDVAGQNLYGFRTPKKRNALETLAASVQRTPQTPKTPATLLKALALDSPRSSRSGCGRMRNVRGAAGQNLLGCQTPNKRNGRETPQTPRTPASKMKTLSLDSPQTSKSGSKVTKTPHRVRDRLKKELKKRAASDSEDDVESEASDDRDGDYKASQSESSSNRDTDESSEEDESEEEAAAAVPQKKNKILKNVRVAKQPIEAVSRRTTRSQRVRQQTDMEFCPQSDNYFSAAATKKVKTSNHTLDRLKSSALHYDDIFALLRTITLSDEHREATTEMILENSQNFGTWMLQLSKGFNIITYGIGSKQCVLQTFCETYPDHPYIIVNGFFPTLTVKDILNGIRTEIVTISATARSDHEIVDGIAAAFQRSPKLHLFLVIHNLDGPMLRKTKDQHILSRLAKIPNVHLLASIDHINAPLMWDQTCLSNYNFVWYDCTTMAPYTYETAFENSVFLQNSGELNLAAMNNVFQSLTLNSRGIYMVLVEAHMKSRKDANYQGMAFKDLYHACRERFLVSSDLTLRTQLTEFYDHNMAKSKRSIDGTEYVSIPVVTHVLEQFVEQQKE